MNVNILNKPKTVTSLKDKILNITPDQVVQGKRCNKCNNVLTIFTRQTRSADEGMTNFFVCKKCKIVKKV